MSAGTRCTREPLLSAAPSFQSQAGSGTLKLALSGAWTVEAGKALEIQSAQLQAAAGSAQNISLDLQSLERLDTAGAWLIDQARVGMNASGAHADFANARPEHNTLLTEAHYRAFDPPAPREAPSLPLLVADIGESVVGAGKDFVGGLDFLGHFVWVIGQAILQPRRWRVTSLVFHMEAFGLRSTPIILLINFLVGAIVAQQGIFQLQRFGATAFTVDLIGILVLRELGVLLTSIMIAGRSGSAITAEIGSMKMGEEIDALQVMALDPMEILIAPRILALILVLPLLTFLADMAAIFGGLCIAWVYGDLSPQVFVGRLQDAIGVNTFAVGLIKAPFMALVIGVIASVEGLNVQGSAQSLGRRVTEAVVKSIFMVIVVDGVFAIFFASIRY